MSVCYEAAKVLTRRKWDFADWKRCILHGRGTGQAGHYTWSQFQRGACFSPAAVSSLEATEQPTMKTLGDSRIRRSTSGVGERL